MYKAIIFTIHLFIPFFSMGASSAHLQKHLSYKAGHKTDEQQKGFVSPERQAKLLSRENDKNLYKALKPSLLISSADEFSGALEWAHKQGITGEGVLILVHENPEITSELRKKMGARLILGKGKYALSLEHPRTHATPVINTIDIIAPQVNIFVESFFAIKSQSFKDDAVFQTSLKKARIINISAATSPVYLDWKILSKEDSDKVSEHGSHDFIQDMESFLKTGNQKLFVAAAGNDHRSLSEGIDTDEEDENHKKIKFYYDPIRYLNNKPIKETLIIATALTPSHEIAEFSNYPGWNKAIQDNTLCTLGARLATMGAHVDKIESKLIHRIDYMDGTSGAAPVISGTAALLMEAYPSLTAAQIKEVLLESADRSFFKNTGKQESYRQSGDWVYGPYTGTLVYDSREEQEPDLTHFPKKQYNSYAVEKEKFDPAKYGKGVMNIRNAFVYAHLKVSNPNLSPIELRSQMRTILQDIQEKAATKIKVAFRGYKTRIHDTQEKAAIKLQSAFRGYQIRSRIKKLGELDDIHEMPLPGTRINRGYYDDELKAYLRKILSKKGKANPAGLFP